MAESAEPKITVLVPTYNVERYLPQCLDALCAQTLRDIEIICINDGATDGSPSILRSYAAKDQRILATVHRSTAASPKRKVNTSASSSLMISLTSACSRSFIKMPSAPMLMWQSATSSTISTGQTTYGTTSQSANVVSPLIPLASRISSALFLLSGRGCIVARFWNVKAFVSAKLLVPLFRTPALL